MKKDITLLKRHPARRWVVEITNSWHGRFRKLFTRCERETENHLLGLVQQQLSCKTIIYRKIILDRPLVKLTNHCSFEQTGYQNWMISAMFKTTAILCFAIFWTVFSTVVVVLFPKLNVTLKQCLKLLILDDRFGIDNKQKSIDRLSGFKA